VCSVDREPGATVFAPERIRGLQHANFSSALLRCRRVVVRAGCVIGVGSDTIAHFGESDRVHGESGDSHQWRGVVAGQPAERAVPSAVSRLPLRLVIPAQPDLAQPIRAPSRGELPLEEDRPDAACEIALSSGSTRVADRMVHEGRLRVGRVDLASQLSRSPTMTRNTSAYVIAAFRDAPGQSAEEATMRFRGSAPRASHASVRGATLRAPASAPTPGP
jgi:hypothetical protein